MNKVFLLVLFAANLAFAGSKVAPDVPRSNPSALTEVIIQFKNQPTPEELKQVGQVKRRLDLIRAVHAALPQQAIQALTANPNIAYISPNRSLRGSLDITTQAVNATVAWQSGWTGAGVGVAVM